MTLEMVVQDQAPPRTRPRTQACWLGIRTSPHSFETWHLPGRSLSEPSYWAQAKLMKYQAAMGWSKRGEFPSRGDGVVGMNLEGRVRWIHDRDVSRFNPH